MVERHLLPPKYGLFTSKNVVGARNLMLNSIDITTTTRNDPLAGVELGYWRVADYYSDRAPISLCIRRRISRYIMRPTVLGLFTISGLQ